MQLLCPIPIGFKLILLHPEIAHLPLIGTEIEWRGQPPPTSDEAKESTSVLIREIAECLPQVFDSRVLLFYVLIMRCDKTVDFREMYGDIMEFSVQR